MGQGWMHDCKLYRLVCVSHEFFGNEKGCWRLHKFENYFGNSKTRQAMKVKKGKTQIKQEIKWDSTHIVCQKFDTT